MGPAEVTCIAPGAGMVTQLCQSPRRSGSERERLHAGKLQTPVDISPKLPGESEHRSAAVGYTAASGQKQLSPVSGRSQLCESPMQQRKMATVSEKRATTTYASVTPVVLTEFVPSRATRPSQNVALQEHISDGRTVIQQRGLFPGPGRVHKRCSEPRVEPLPGEYAQIDFSKNASKPKAESGPSLGTLLAHGGSGSSAGVYGLEKSCEYENLCRPRNNIQASVWLAHRPGQGRVSPPSVPSDPQRPLLQRQHSSTANSPKPEHRQLLSEEPCEEVHDGGLSGSGVSSRASRPCPFPPQTLTQDGAGAEARPGSSASVCHSSSQHQLLQGRLSNDSAADHRNVIVPYASVSTVTALESDCVRNAKGGEQVAKPSSPFVRRTSTGSTTGSSVCAPFAPPPVYQNSSASSHFRSPSAPVDLPTRQYSNSVRIGCRNSQQVAPDLFRGRSSSTSSSDAALPSPPEIAVNDVDHEHDSSGYGGSSESVDHENLPVLPPRRSSVSPPRHRSSPENDHHSSLTVEVVHSAKRWRQSTADELFGTFSLDYMGSELVDKGYGAVVSTMNKVIGACRELHACTMNVTAAAVQIYNEEGNPMLRHEVDSIESLSPYGSGSPSDPAHSYHQCYLAYVVVREGVAAVCHVFKSISRESRDTALKTIESALYADVKCYKSMTYPQYGIQRIQTRCSQFSVKYIGQILVQTTYRVIDEAARRLLRMTHPAKVGFAFMDISTDRIRLSGVTTSAIFAAHQTSTIASLGAFSEDSRVFGYVIKQKRMGTKCHIFRSSRPSEALAVVDIIRDVCQESYIQQHTTHVVEEVECTSPRNGLLGFFSRRRSAHSGRNRSVSAPAGGFWAGSKYGTAIARTGTGSVIHQATAITENDITTVPKKSHRPPLSMEESPYGVSS